jgi:hypothetical protein
MSMLILEVEGLKNLRVCERMEDWREAPSSHCASLRVSIDRDLATVECERLLGCCPHVHNLSYLQKSQL